NIALPIARRSEVRMAPKLIDYKTLPVVKLNSSANDQLAESDRGVVVVSSPTEALHSELTEPVPLVVEPDSDVTPSDQTSASFTVPSDDLEMQNFLGRERLAKSKQLLQSEPLGNQGLSPLPGEKSNVNAQSDKFCTS